jgi:signal transduction histidine kinase/ligand-binding sensor domain-containing protein
MRLFLLLFVMTATISEAKPDPGARFRDQYRIRTWGTAHGLGAAKLNAVHLDRKGFLWVASQRGLFRFDGIHFTPLVSKHFPQVGTATYLDVTEDKRGVIWAGTLDIGIVRIEGDSIRFYSQENSRIPANIQKSIVVDSAGTVWSGAYHGGLTRLDADTVTAVYGTADGLEDDAIWTLISSEPGKLWVGTNGGIFRFENGKFQKSTAALGLGNSILRSLLLDKNGTLWAGTDGGGITLIENGRATAFINSKIGLQNDFILGMSERPEGMWLATYGAGLILFTGDNAMAISKFSGLSNNFVFDIAVANNGTVWAATDDGLSALIPRPVTWLSASSGLKEETQFGLFLDSKHRLWASPNGGGVQYRDAGVWKSIGLNEGLPISFIYCFEEDRAGNIWIGTQGGGTYRLAKGKVDHSITTMKDKFVRTLKTDRKGRIWMGTGRGLHLIPDPVNAPTTFLTINDSLFVSNLLERHNGDIVVATYGSGLVVFDSTGTLKTRLSKKNSAVPDRIFSLLEDRNKNLWVGSRSEGVVLITPDSLFKWNGAAGFPESVPALAEDEDGTIWMGIGTYGLAGFPAASIEALKSGQTKIIEPLILNAFDGLPDATANSGFSGGVVRDSSGTFWFSTMKGIIGFNPSTFSASASVAVYLRQIRLNGNSISLGDAPLIMEEYDRDLEIDYSAMSLTGGEKMRFRYRLNGLTETWNEAGSRTTAFFPSLPPGTYTFEVSGTDRFGRYQSPVPLFKVTVNNPWWWSPWMLSAALAGLILLIGGITRLVVALNVRQLRRKLEIQTRLQEERKRISRDLHDSVGSNLTNLIIGLEMTRTMLDKRQSKKARAWLETLDADARGTMQELRSSIWLLDREQVSYSELATHIRTYLKKTSAYAPNIQTTVTEVIEKDDKVRSDTALHLLRLFQEAWHNCRKHSGASQFTVKVSGNEKGLTLELHDNGSGFSIEERRGSGNGLANMEHRAAVIGASFSITSGSETGTRITIHLKEKTA